jgi:cytochrome c biogenesis protein CcmG/thiol:disulfide interchange protein DsbE
MSVHEAGDGGRTRDLWLGKPTLYQLSYTRLEGASVPITRSPGSIGAGAGRPPLTFGTVRNRPLVPIVVGVLSLALVGLLVYGVVHRGQNTTLDDAVKKGGRPQAPAATISMPLINGMGKRSLAQLRGKVVVLNFWASWCEPCRREARRLEKTQQTLLRNGKGTVLGATYEDDVEDSQAFEREFSLTYPSVRDVGTKVAKGYGTRALPETFVLDAEGRVVAISRGEASQAFLDKAVATAMAATPVKAQTS